MLKEHEVTKGSLQESVELLTKRNNEIDLKLKMTESDYAKDMERLHEKVQELETKLQEQRDLTEEKLRKIEDLENQLKQVNGNAQENVKSTELAVFAIKKESEKIMQRNLKEKDQKIEVLQKTVSEMEEKVKEATDLAKARENEKIKDAAIKQ